MVLVRLHNLSFILTKQNHSVRYGIWYFQLYLDSKTDEETFWRRDVGSEVYRMMNPKLFVSPKSKTLDRYNPQGENA